MLTSIKHTARLFRIGLTLARNDAIFLLEELNVSPTLTSICKWLAKKNVNESRGKRIANALESLGPSFIKLGQALSTRPDLVGEEISTDLSDLRDQIPPFDSATAKQIIEEEFGASIEDLFELFDDEPIAAASIAQVHKAKTKDGKKVAVKVLRPNIAKAFAKDVDLLLWMAEIVEHRLPNTRRFSPIKSVQTFANTVRLELDLRFEAACAAELKENTKHDDGFYVPDVFWKLTSERVLTTEWIKGISLNDQDALDKAKVDYKQLVEHAATAFFSQVFRDGFFHADMHPGNLFVMPDNTLSVVDFGIMGRISRRNQIFLAEMLWGFLNEDYHAVAKAHIDHGVVPATQDIDAFAMACRAIAKPILDRPLNEISVGKLLGQLFHVAQTFEMRTKPELLLLQKNMMLTEGIGRTFQPDVNMWKLAEPLINDWAKNNLTPKARMRESVKETLDELHKLPAILKQAETVIGGLSEGGLKLHPETAKLLSGNKSSQRQWLVMAWLALGLLAFIGLKLSVNL